MLEVLNQYAHGFVVVPVVLACRKGGVFAALQQEPRSAEELSRELGANLGHLQVALRLLESLGWIDRIADGRFTANAATVKQSLVPEALLALLHTNMDIYLHQGQGGMLAPWIQRVRARWGTEDELIANFLDGLLVVPVLALLARRGAVAEMQKLGFANLPKGVRKEVNSLFESLGFIEGSAGSYQVTEPGRFMFERAMNLGVAESYRPMLAEMDRLLFGDAQSVFAHDAAERESHVGRAINVISSGFQHDRYFAEVDQLVLEIFSREPLSAQPRWVADTGCGDGTFLKRVYETVCGKTPRGKRLAEYPLGVIGIDLNEASRDETARTLSGIDHYLIAGDIGNPDKIADALRDLGIDPAQVLHIRSFLDHDRPFIPPRDHEGLQARANSHYLGVYADRRGNAIPPAAVVQSLVEHLKRWAEVVTEHGLIMLEVHCQDPMVVRKHIDQSESLYFDAIESFSQQLMVEADVALMAAAEAGLFPRRESLRKYPEFLPYCRITLNHFERRPYRVRPARHSDLPSLLHLEEACWQAELRTSGDELLRRIDTHDLGQWVIEMDGEIVGAVYSQRIADVDRLRSCKLRDVAELNEDGAPVIQLLGLNVLPAKQHLGLGDQLLDLILMRAALQGGIRQLVGITRCKNFTGQSVAELAQYVEQRDAAGRPVDPVLYFHYSHGAQFLGVVEGYRPEDTSNLGTGALLAYDLGSLLAQGKVRATGAESKSAVDTKSQLETCLRRLLGPAREGAFSWNRPLREMGLDSLNLLEFRILLQQTFGKPFSTTFFFSHPALQDIERYLSEGKSNAESLNATHATKQLKQESGTRIPIESRKKTAVSEDSLVEDRDLIAVIGMAARFPGCDDLPGFWRVLENGQDAIAEVPAERWDVDEFYSSDPDAPGKTISRRGGFLRKVDEFDASFFSISPREAELMDPQQRLLLEMHWEAIEHAGIDANQLRESACGFFVGLASHDYELLQVAHGGESSFGAHYATGNSPSIASGRLAYWFGTRGPAITLDTACSSSLVAVHQAIRSLRTGECKLAIASGANLILSPRLSIAYSKAGMLSPRGCCSTFDAAADGYVRSEGCAVVVLKRLDDAVRDDDRILAVIRGSAVNQDGASNGLTAPSVPAQEALVRSALADAKLEPSDIDYVEAHGTGTQLGDPVEFEALRNVFQADQSRTEPLWLGSVKTNIGHTEAVAGIAGLIKTVLALQHKRIPAHLHFHSPNSQIDLDSVPARIPVRCEDWRRKGAPLRAGVSSFGFSGTNAHVIVEQAPELSASPGADSNRSIHLLTLSAKGAPALQALSVQYAEWLPKHKNIDLGDICAAASAGRTHHEFRMALNAVSPDELVRCLRESSARGAIVRPIKAAPKIAFLFTGQGSQYSGMARELFLTEPTFRQVLNECFEILDSELSAPLLGILYPDSSETRLIDETANTQPALFAIEYALARMLQSWCVEPVAVMGHSVGEYVAACIAGIFSLQDGLKLIAARGRLMQALPRNGAMLAILGRAESVIEGVKEFGGTVSIAAFNGPGNTVISGRRSAVEALGRRLEEGGLRAVPLPVSHAFHSDLMEPILPAFREVAQLVRFAPPGLTFASNLTGDLAPETVSAADYWVDHIRRPVQFAKGIRALAQSGVDVMLEIGPHPVLSAMGRACLDSAESDSIQWLHTLARGNSDWDRLVMTLGALYEAGTPINWRQFYAGRDAHRVDLPSYPWQRKRYWLALSGTSAKQSSAAPSEAPGDWFYETRWVPRSRLDEESARPLADFLPSTALLAEKLRQGAPALAKEFGVENSGRDLAAIEAASQQYAVGALLELGLAGHGNEPIEEGRLAEHLGIAPRHRRLFGRIVEMLAEAGIVRRTSEGLQIDRHSLEGYPKLKGEAEGASSSCKIELALLHRCGANLAAILRGEEDPLPLLFPDNGALGAEHLYRAAPHSRLFNTLIADAVSDAARSAPRDRVLRILELGAGTGGTASSIFDRLRDHHTEYFFTDVSKSLLEQSAERFSNRTFVRYGLLDIEGDPGAQGFGTGQFDLIIASNVIHATRDLRRTLSHIRQLLAPRGMFLLLEATASRKWVDLTFGLTTGWWSFRDSQIRPAYPLLDPDTWSPLLTSEGFCEVEAIRSDEADSLVFDQSLFLMRASSDAPALQEVSKVPRSANPRGHWLIVGDRSGFADALDRQLRVLGDETTVINAAEISGSISSSGTSRLGDLLDSAHNEGQPPLRGVIHLASLDLPNNDSLETRDLAETCQLGCESAVRLVQAILGREWREPPKVWFVTRGAQSIETADTAPSLAQMPVWGVGKVMALEHPDIWGGLIDVAPTDDPEIVSEMLAREVYRPDSEDEIVFRAENRFVARLTPFVPPPSCRQSFKADASYLITGGLGKIGLKVARWLVDRGARSIVLVGRTPLADSPSTQAQSMDSKGYDKVGIIESLRRDGVRVEVQAANVADRDAMTALFSRFGKDLLPLKGVIHAAGVVETTPIRKLGPSDFASAFPSKTSGAWILHEMTCDIDLDFFVLFSSTASSFGVHGVAAYAAANTFLDALVFVRRARGLSAVAINWGWWEEGGTSRRIDEFTGNIGLKRMPTPLALDALGRLLNSDRMQTTVANVDWPVFLPIHATKRGRSFLAALRAPVEEKKSAEYLWQEPGETFLSRLRGMSSEGAKQQLAQHVRDTVASVLHLDPREPIDDARGFFTLGADSMMTGELRNHLQKSLHWKLPATIAFEYPTIRNLAEYLFHELGLADSAAIAVPGAESAAVAAFDDLEDSELASILDEELTRVLHRTPPYEHAD